MTSSCRQKKFIWPTQEFKRLSLKPVVVQGLIYYTFLNISVPKVVTFTSNPITIIIIYYYISGTKSQGFFNLTPLSVTGSLYFIFVILYYYYVVVLGANKHPYHVWQSGYCNMNVCNSTAKIGPRIYL